MAKIPPLLVLAMIAVSLPIVVSVIRVSQDTRNRAAGCTAGRLGTCGACCDGGTCYRDRDANCNVTKSCTTQTDPGGCSGAGGGPVTSKSPKEPTSKVPTVAKPSTKNSPTPRPSQTGNNTAIDDLKQGDKSCGSSPAGTTSIGPGGKIYGCDGSTGRWEDMTGKGVGPEDLTDRPSWLTEDSDRWAELEKTSGKINQVGGGDLPQNNMPTGNYAKPNGCAGNYAPGSVAIGPGSVVYECGYDGHWRECSYCVLNVVPQYVEESRELLEKYIVDPLKKQQIIRDYINLPSYELAAKYCGNDQECLKNFNEEQYLSQVEGLTGADIANFEQLREVAQTKPTPVPTREPTPTRKPTIKPVATATSKPTITTGPTATGKLSTTPTGKPSGTVSPTKKPTITNKPTVSVTSGAKPTVSVAPSGSCSGTSAECSNGSKYTCVNGRWMENSNPGECYQSYYQNPPVPTNGKSCGDTPNGNNVCAGSRDCRVCNDGRLQEVSSSLCVGQPCYFPEPTPVSSREGDLAYFDQTDPRWGTKSLSDGSNLSGAACGPTSVAMLACSLTDTCLSPDEMINEFYENMTSQGTSFTENLAVMMQLGMNPTLVPTDPSKLANYTNSNQPVFIRGNFCVDSRPDCFGHFSVLTGVSQNADGSYNYTFNDPYLGENVTLHESEVDITNAAVVSS